MQYGSLKESQIACCRELRWMTRSLFSHTVWDYLIWLGSFDPLEALGSSASQTSTAISAFTCQFPKRNCTMFPPKANARGCQLPVAHFEHGNRLAPSGPQSRDLKKPLQVSAITCIGPGVSSMFEWLVIRKPSRNSRHFWGYRSCEAWNTFVIFQPMGWSWWVLRTVAIHLAYIHNLHKLRSLFSVPQDRDNQWESSLFLPEATRCGAVKCQVEIKLSAKSMGLKEMAGNLYGERMRHIDKQYTLW